MNCRLFLLLALLSSCSGESAVGSPLQSVVALAGGDVILPCSVVVPDSGDFPTVEWSKERLQPNVVLLYRDGCDVPEMKHAAFRYRTSLLTGELNNGNVSLRISGVRLADAGTYRCLRLWGDGARDVSAVQLAVAVVSDPELSVAPAGGGGGGGVAALCEAHCWLPEPRIHFLDLRGNEVPADEPKVELDARGCFTVRRRAALHAATDRITCRVQQTETNQSRDAHILIPVGSRKSCAVAVVISAAATLFVSVAVFVSAICLWRRFRKTGTRKLSEGSTGSGSSAEDPLLIQIVQPERSEVIDTLTVKVNDLQKELHEKDEMIRQLQSRNHQPEAGPAARPGPEPGDVPESRQRRPGVVRQNSNPAPERPTSAIQRNHSSPALLHLAASSAQKKPGGVGRSLSDAHRLPAPNATTPRRHSFVVPFPAPHNRHIRMDALSEETEGLISS